MAFTFIQELVGFLCFFDNNDFFLYEVGYYLKVTIIFFRLFLQLNPGNIFQFCLFILLPELVN